MFRISRTSLCVALLFGTLTTGCSGTANPVSVAQPARPMRIQTTHPTAGAQWVDQIGNFNEAIIDNPANPIWLRQVGNFNFIDVDEINGPLRVNQVGNFNRVLDE